MNKNKKLAKYKNVLATNFKYFLKFVAKINEENKDETS